MQENVITIILIVIGLAIAAVIYTVFKADITNWCTQIATRVTNMIGQTDTNMKASTILPMLKSMF